MMPVFWGLFSKVPVQKDRWTGGWLRPAVQKYKVRHNKLGGNGEFPLIVCVVSCQRFDILGLNWY